MYKKFKEGIYAGIDCGTGGMRMLVARVNTDGTTDRLHAQSINHDIGHDLNASGRITDATAVHLVESAAQLVATAKSLGAEGVRAVGTASFREAENGDDVLKSLSEQAVPFELLTGMEELELSLQGVMPYIPDIDEDFYFADSGGGSTEVALVNGKTGRVLAGKSLSFGVSSLAKQLADIADKPSPEQLTDFTKGLVETLSRKMAEWDKPGTDATKLVMAGSPLYLKRFQLKHEEPRRDEYIGKTIGLEDILTIAEDLAGLGHEGRTSSKYLDDAGVFFMLPAAVKGAALLQATGTKEIIIASSGICAGLALQQAAFEQEVAS